VFHQIPPTVAYTRLTLCFTITGDDANRNTRPQLLVTASVDRVRLLRKLSLEEDVVLSGAVAWVGNSSMVIRMEAWPATHPDAPTGDLREDDAGDKNKKVKENSNPKESESESPSPKYSPGPSLSADFTFVARDAVTNKAAAVNSLLPGTETEKALFASTAKRVEHKKKRLKLLKAGDQGLSETLQLAKRTFVESVTRETRTRKELPSLASADDILSTTTKTENIFVAQPQQRNLSGRIFGGFLLRRAFELAFATSYVFGGSRPTFKSVRDMDFLKPVDVGDLLRFKARVLHVDFDNGKDNKVSSHDNTQFVDVEVECFVTRPEMVTSEVSNTFLFTFFVDSQNGKTTKRVLPNSKEDAAHVWERCVRPRIDTETDYGR
jgi:acyl-coenzyme A thioesterase 9